MPATPTATPAAPLSPAVLSAMLAAALDSLPHRPQASAEEIATQRRAAQELMEDLRPRDPVEAMLAARYVAANEAAFDAFRRAAQPNLPVDLTLRLRGKGISLWRLADQTMRELQFRQKRAPLQSAERPATAPAPRPAAPVAAQAMPAPQPAPQAAAPPRCRRRPRAPPHRRRRPPAPHRRRRLHPRANTPCNPSLPPVRASRHRLLPGHA